MVNSMTSFATRNGQGAGFCWAWELRSVNAKGLDLRLRVPEWIEGLEQFLRAQLGVALGRGSVGLSLKITRDEDAGELHIDHAQLGRVMAALALVNETADVQGLELRPPSALEILSMRGVQEMSSTPEDSSALKAILLERFGPLLAAFLKMRASEGRALDAVLRAQLVQIADLIKAAKEVLESRRTATSASFRAALLRIVESVDAIDEQRVAQELALLAVRSDITEELDRLEAHVAAAGSLLGAKGPVGRKLDFLCQEFNREANTLCAKSQSSDLTRIGLDLKAVIDQMREQVQNIE